MELAGKAGRFYERFRGSQSMEIFQFIDTVRRIRETMIQRLFVYGTLVPGGPNEHVLNEIGGSQNRTFKV